MENKEKYYLALAENKGRLNEIDLGEILGFEAGVTRQLIAQLMAEHRIEYFKNDTCHYRIMKRVKASNWAANLE